ncbi:3-hydroxyacyl-CoA dehydrogenase NAD-binding domain-containing protein [Pseudaestuariivita sp.]|uniref:3-hydroxyacyl-CoA dehydrogenase NAD-binding domain-containing protein n=1 Tax=Pseudaestuariivita sp. TaxID=2211669 RepID=UPI00405A050A
MSLPPRVFLLGAGAIGTAFAAAFRAAGWSVTLCDTSLGAREAAADSVSRHTRSLRRASYSEAETPGALDLVDAIPEASHFDLAIEAGPERLELKAAVFQEMLKRLGPDTILTTASSAIPMSEILPEPADQARCLVAHPGNPPSLIRVIELVPAPGTSPDTVTRADILFRRAGFAPVALGKEVPAFVFNRLQSALLREAYRLVDEGVVDVDGIDRLVRDGLGPRWALSGPFETADLNTAGGIRGHAERLGPAYAAIGAARGETQAHWSPDLVDKVEAERRAILPEKDLPKRRMWRETALADLLAARRRLLAEGFDE